MALRFENLDARTRQFMLEELDRDAASGSLYLSPRLSERGRQDYPALLREALESGSDISLANSLCFHGRLQETEQRKTRGGVKTVSVPATAADMLAEGEFNRYYMRGLCRRALADGIRQVVVYRARGVRQARAGSKALQGQPIDAQNLLDNLRARLESETSTGEPFGPNSGLSVKLP